MITYCVFSARDMMSIDTTARLMADHFMKNKLGVMTIDNDKPIIFEQSAIPFLPLLKNRRMSFDKLQADTTS